MKNGRSAKDDVLEGIHEVRKGLADGRPLTAMRLHVMDAVLRQVAELVGEKLVVGRPKKWQGVREMREGFEASERDPVGRTPR